MTAIAYFSILPSSIVCRRTIISNTCSTSFRISAIQSVALSTGKKSRSISNDDILRWPSSVIDPEEYAKRIVRFLFEKVLIDSKQTLDELLASPVVCTSYSRSESTTVSLNGSDSVTSTEETKRESFEVIQILNKKQIPLVDTHVLPTTTVLQNLALQSLSPTDNEPIFLRHTEL